MKHETISFMYFQFNDDHYNFQDKKIGYVRFAKKPWLKVLFADLLWEKNIVRSLK